MGTFLDWFFGGEPNPPKNYPPEGLRGNPDESWRDDVQDSFTVYLPTTDEAHLPASARGTPQCRRPLDLRECSPERPEQSKAS